MTREEILKRNNEYNFKVVDKSDRSREINVILNTNKNDSNFYDLWVLDDANFEDAKYFGLIHKESVDARKMIEDLGRNLWPWKSLKAYLINNEIADNENLVNWLNQKN